MLRLGKLFHRLADFSIGLVYLGLGRVQLLLAFGQLFRPGVQLRLRALDDRGQLGDALLAGRKLGLRFRKLGFQLSFLGLQPCLLGNQPFLLGNQLFRALRPLFLRHSFQRFYLLKNCLDLPKPGLDLCKPAFQLSDPGLQLGLPLLELRVLLLIGREGRVALLDLLLSFLVLGPAALQLALGAYNVSSAPVCLLPAVRRLLSGVQVLLFLLREFRLAVRQLLFSVFQLLLCVRQLRPAVRQLLLGVRQLLSGVFDLLPGVRDLLAALLLNLGVPDLAAPVRNLLDPLHDGVRKLLIGVAVAARRRGLLYLHTDLRVIIHHKSALRHSQKAVQRTVPDTGIASLQRDIIGARDCSRHGKFRDAKDILRLQILVRGAQDHLAADGHAACLYKLIIHHALVFRLRHPAFLKREQVQLLRDRHDLQIQLLILHCPEHIHGITGYRIPDALQSRDALHILLRHAQGSLHADIHQLRLLVIAVRRQLHIRLGGPDA